MYGHLRLLSLLNGLRTELAGGHGSAAIMSGFPTNRGGGLLTTMEGGPILGPWAGSGCRLSGGLSIGDRDL